MNFLPLDNKLHDRPKHDVSSEGEFSPWNMSDDSEVTVSDVEESKRVQAQAQDLPRATRRKSNPDPTPTKPTVLPPGRHASPGRQSMIPDTSRSVFQRSSTPLRNSHPTTSLLSSALKSKGWAIPTAGSEADLSTGASSSTEDFSDLGDVTTEDEEPHATLSTLTARPVPMRSLPSSMGSHSVSPRRKRGFRAGTSPATGSTLRRRAGVESEPEEGSTKVDDKFLELLDATKEFLSFSNATVNSRPFANSPTSTSGRPTGPPQPAESSASSNEIEVPTDFAASAILSDSQDEPPRSNPSPKPTALWSWFARIIEVRVWQAVAVWSLAFSAGLGLGFSLSSSRRLRFEL